MDFRFFLSSHCNVGWNARTSLISTWPTSCERTPRSGLTVSGTTGRIPKMGWCNKKVATDQAVAPDRWSSDHQLTCIPTFCLVIYFDILFDIILNNNNIYIYVIIYCATFYLTLADILPGILYDKYSDIYSDICSGIYSKTLLPTLYLTFSLAFYLTFHLTFYLTVYLASYPPDLA